MKTTLDLARTYTVALGWHVVPIRPRSKKLALRSLKLVEHGPSGDALLRKWFAGTEKGVAVLLGSASGGLVCRDFDDHVAYEHWAMGNGELARTLPTVRTSRGFHVYFRADLDDIRRVIGTETSVVNLGDGELRFGPRVYCVLPPTIHPSGQPYAWINGSMPRLQKLGVPVLGIDETSFLSAGNVTESTERTENTQHNECVPMNAEAMGGVQAVVHKGVPIQNTRPSNLTCEIEDAIHSTLPSGYGQRCRCVFEFARVLKGITALSDADVNDLEPYVRIWHRRALPNIRTQPFEETFYDFAYAWPRLKFPGGQDVVGLMRNWANSAEIPAIAKKYEQPALRSLVAICRELHRRTDGNAFFLSCRTAGKVVGVSHKQAHRWLCLLEIQKILRCVAKGTLKPRRASRFEYIAPE